jgi:hypothetical protein
MIARPVRHARREVMRGKTRSACPAIPGSIAGLRKTL